MSHKNMNCLLPCTCLNCILAHPLGLAILGRLWPSDDDDDDNDDDDDGDNHYHVSSNGLIFIFTTKKTMTQEIPGQFRLVASLFAKTSTAVNPFIYFFMSEGFRKDTSSVFRRFQNLLV